MVVRDQAPNRRCGNLVLYSAWILRGPSDDGSRALPDCIALRSDVLQDWRARKVIEQNIGKWYEDRRS